MFAADEFCKSAKDLPTIYDINPGTMGRTQGERKLSTPANKQSIALNIIDEENKSIPNIRLYIVWLD